MKKVPEGYEFKRHPLWKSETVLSLYGIQSPVELCSRVKDKKMESGLYCWSGDGFLSSISTAYYIHVVKDLYLFSMPSKIDIKNLGNNIYYLFIGPKPKLKLRRKPLQSVIK